jgi:hypothetical protein
MKTLTRLLSGFAASLLLAVGLHAAAERLDPITTDAGALNPADSTTDGGKISCLPCQACQIED